MFGDSKKMHEETTLGPVTTHGLGDVESYDKSSNDAAVDDVFGEIDAGGINYRSVGWTGSAVIMFKTQVGLGVLGIPAAFDTLGMIPGVIMILLIAFMTTWAAWMVGQFKLRHPHVYGIDEAGRLIFGTAGRELFFWAFALQFTFIAGSAMIGISTAFNAVSVHGACTAIFVAVAAVMGFICGCIPTLAKVSWIAWLGMICILSAIFTLTIAVGVQDRPAAAPQTGVYESNYKLFGSPTFAEAISAVSTLVFAFSCLPAFFACYAEMKEPKKFTRALCVAQGSVTVIYLCIGVVVYYYCGSYVASPALGSAGPLLKRVCYGIALPGLLASCMLFIHMPAKAIFMRVMRNSEHLTKNTMRHWVVWLGCVALIAAVAYIVANAIPVFSALLSLVGALLATITCFQPTALMWLYDNSGWWKGAENWILPTRTWKYYVNYATAMLLLIGGTFVTIGGTYGAVLEIIAAKRTSPWSCADNSHST